MADEHLESDGEFVEVGLTESAEDAGEQPEIGSDVQDPKATELSQEFVGRWTKLISTTNWDKGKIICQWREALIGSESHPSTYSDEAWSQRVGGVTAQHVGRLRRVYERFASTYASFEGLYWSHFWAALDWDDAEMWLEGALQSGWSVSQMRRTRWEAMGADPAQQPTAEASSVVIDEDYTPLAEAENDTGLRDSPRSVAEGPRPDGPDFGDETEPGQEGFASATDDDEALPWEDDGSTASQQSPFAKLPSLPADMAEALEQFKLSIIRHRADEWSEVDQRDVLQAIEALRIFASQ